MGWYFLRERGEERWGNAKLALAPQDTLSMYVATGRQLWGTQDGGKSWESIGRGLGDYAWFNDVAVDPVNPSLVYAATPRGLYRWDRDAPITAVEEEHHIVPAGFSLGQNYPNPFNPTTTIRFSLPQRGEAELSIYNLLGQRVVTLVKGMQEAGTQVLQWEGQDAQGRALASGIYLCRLQAGAQVETRKVLLLR